MAKQKQMFLVPKDLSAGDLSALVHICEQVEEDIQIERNNIKVNAKSVMGVLSLGIMECSNITVITETKETLDVLTKCFEEHFGFIKEV